MMRRLVPLLLIPAAVVGIGYVAVSTPSTTLAALSADTPVGSSGPCAPLSDSGAPGGSTFATLSAEQRQNGKIIVDVATKLHISPFGAQIAVATSMQESALRNINYGDRDSIGLFQQRDAWGSRDDRLNPAASATMFFKGGHGGQPGLLSIPGWEKMPLGAAAQAVQVSAFPDRYDQWGALAAQVVKSGGGGSVTCGDSGGSSVGTPQVEKAIKFALAQRGKPYVWGGTGPDGWDCSGLMLRAWESAGVRLPRVADAQYNAGRHVPLSAAKRGDLLFWSPGDPSAIHHVAMYLGDGKIVEAQQTGVPVHERAISLSPPEGELYPSVVRLST